MALLDGAEAALEPLKALSTELVLEICRWLQPSDLASLASTCRPLCSTVRQTVKSLEVAAWQLPRLICRACGTNAAAAYGAAPGPSAHAPAWQQHAHADALAATSAPLPHVGAQAFPVHHGPHAMADSGLEERYPWCHALTIYRSQTTDHEQLQQLLAYLHRHGGNVKSITLRDITTTSTVDAAASSQAAASVSEPPSGDSGDVAMLELGAGQSSANAGTSGSGNAEEVLPSGSSGAAAGGGGTHAGDHGSAGAGGPVLELPTLPSLESLTIEVCSASDRSPGLSMDTRNLIALLAPQLVAGRCPSLRALRMRWVHGTCRSASFDPYLPHVASLGVNLQELNIGPLDMTAQGVWPQLSRLAGLRRLLLYGRSLGVAAEQLRALLRALPHLLQLKLFQTAQLWEEGDDVPQPGDLQQVQVVQVQGHPWNGQQAAAYIWMLPDGAAAEDAAEAAAAAGGLPAAANGAAAAAAAAPGGGNPPLHPLLQQQQQVQEEEPDGRLAQHPLRSLMVPLSRRMVPFLMDTLPRLGNVRELYLQVFTVMLAGQQVELDQLLAGPLRAMAARLRTLQLDTFNITPSTLDAMARLTGLSELILYGGSTALPTADGLAALSALSGLRALCLDLQPRESLEDIDEGPAQPEDERALLMEEPLMRALAAGLPNLQSLHYGCKMLTPTLVRLGAFSQLTSLSVHNCVALRAGGGGVAYVLHLAHLPPMLRALALSRVALLHGPHAPALAGEAAAAAAAAGGTDDIAAGLQAAAAGQLASPPPLLHLWLDSCLFWPAALVQQHPARAAAVPAGAAAQHPLPQQQQTQAFTAGRGAGMSLSLRDVTVTTIDLPGLLTAFPSLETLVMMPEYAAWGSFIGSPVHYDPSLHARTTLHFDYSALAAPAHERLRASLRSVGLPVRDPRDVAAVGRLPALRHALLAVAGALDQQGLEAALELADSTPPGGGPTWASSYYEAAGSRPYMVWSPATLVPLARCTHLHTCWLGYCADADAHHGLLARQLYGLQAWAARELPLCVVKQLEQEWFSRWPTPVGACPDEQDPLEWWRIGGWSVL